MASPYSDLLPFLLRPGARQVNDRSAAQDCNWRSGGAALPAGLSLQWFGTACFAISYEGTTILTDPFVTRRPITEVLRAKPLPSDDALVERLLPRCDAVLVGHAHFDHVLDLPAVVRRDGCTVYGSKSVHHLLGLFGLAEHGVIATPHQPIEIGPFTVSFVPSVHSKLLGGLAIPQGGELTCEHTESLTQSAYRCGQVWGIRIEVAGITLYHQGSCDLLDEEIREPCDVFLCGIAGRSFTKDYVARIIGRLKPSLVIPHHHDNFFLPLEQEMGFSVNVNFGGFLQELRDVDPDLPVRSLEPMQCIGDPIG